jgi:hypothetical protein
MLLKKLCSKKCLIIILPIILAVIFTIQSTSANNEFFSVGKDIKSILNTQENKVLASVNGRNITQQDLDRAFILQNFLYELQKEEFEKIKQEGTFTQEQLTYMEPKPKTKDEVLQELIEKEMLYLESIEQGCAVSDEEVERHIEEQKKLYQDILDGKGELANNQETVIMVKQMMKFAEGMELTLEEYCEYMKPTIKKGLSINRLKNKILQQLPDKERLDYNKSTQAIKEYIETLYGKYKVQINK